MKNCFKCGLLFPLSNFYKHDQMADGPVNKCKSCNKKDVSENYLINMSKDSFIEKERKRGRVKYHRLYEGTGKADVAATIRYKIKYPEKRKAIIACQHLKKPFDKLERHHWSYNEEHYTDVIWLTKKEHMKGHRFLVYDQERMMYRRHDNNILLDTITAHSKFIMDCIVNLED